MHTANRRHYQFGIVVAILAITIGLAFYAPKAESKALVGVGDNSPNMFLDSNFRTLGTKISRKIIPYDYYNSKFELDQLQAWLTNAQALGVEPLISFQHSLVNQKKLPSVAEFKKTLQHFRTNYPSVKTISPWNEANHVTQPTMKNPKRAAEFFNATKAACKGCKIVAADVLDQGNMLPWLKAFRKHAKGPKIWGLHSYADSNKPIPWGKSATKKLLGAVKGEIWLTEVGGLVAFKNNFPYNEQRAAKAVRKTLQLSKKSPRIKRIYLYCWYGAVQPAGVPPYIWDSGLVSAAGVTRPGFDELRKWMK